MTGFCMKVEILGRSFRIKYVSFSVVSERAGQTAVGCMDWEKREILICKDLSERERVLTLYHEFTHVVHYATGLNQIITPEIQEILCETTASLIEDVCIAMEKIEKSAKRRKKLKDAQT